MESIFFRKISCILTCKWTKNGQLSTEHEVVSFDDLCHIQLAKEVSQVPK